MSTEAHKRASLKWKVKNLKQISLEVRHEYYSDVLLPFTKKHGYTMRGFILEAIDYYMKHIEAMEGDEMI